MKMNYDANEIKQALQSRVRELCESLLPGGRVEGGNWRVGSVDGDKGGSLSIPVGGPRVGSWKDFADPDHGGTLIDLVMQVRGMSFPEAIEWAGKDFLGMAPGDRQVRGQEPQIQFTEVPTRELGDPLDFEGEPSKALTWLLSDRKLDPVSLALYGVRTSHGGSCCVLPHVDDDGSVVMAKYWKMNKEVWTSKNPKHILFGKQTVDLDDALGELVICEGQWDAIAWHMAGFPAVSIPSGIDNWQWVTNDWGWLKNFHTIYLSFDMDEPGERAVKNAIQRIGREKCRIVTLPLKDANDMVKADRINEMVQAVDDATYQDPDELVLGVAFEKQVKELCRIDPNTWGLPFMVDMPLRFRENESTVWTGYTGHGKSSAVEDLCCLHASLGVMSCIASLETRSSITLKNMVKKWTGDGDIGFANEFEEAYRDLARHIIMYDYSEKCPPKTLLKRFEYAHRRWGVTNFVIDNVMMLKIDRQDNEAQAEASNDFKEFVKKFPVHLHIVAHPRKPNVGDTPRAPSVHEVRGASEWCDMAFNIVSVWRNIGKTKQLDMLRQQWEDGDAEAGELLQEVQRETCDGLFTVGKQRSTGDLPERCFFYDKESSRTKPSFIEDVQPYWKRVLS